MTQTELEREKRNGRFAGILGIASILFLIAPNIARLGQDFRDVDSDQYAQQLTTFEAVRDEILLATLLTLAGLLLIIPPAYYLYKAAAVRDATVRTILIGLIVVGPLFLGLSQLFFFIAFNDASSSFIDNVPGGVDVNGYAKDAVSDSGMLGVSVGLTIAGVLAGVVGLVYTSLRAMRAGLLTRFVGTLTMALGVGVLLMGPPAWGFWALAVGLVIAGFLPGPRPPAWEAGEAIPWPKPGEVPPQEPEQLADPDEFADEDGDGLPDGAPARPARRDNKKKRKRKQRG